VLGRTIAGYLEHTLRDKEKIALVYKQRYRTRTFTYEQLFAYAHQLTGFFRAKKLQQGDRVLIYASNCPEYGIFLLACSLSGVIAVPIDDNFAPPFVSKIYKQTKAKALFCSRYKQIKQTKMVFIEDLLCELEQYKGYRCKAKVKATAIFEIVYTSGTTSDPKGVVLTNKNILANLVSLESVISLRRKHQFLSIIPLSHLFEQTIGFFLPLRFGLRIVYASSRKSSALLKALQEESITMMVTVPAFLELLKENILREVAKQGNQRQFTIALALAKPLPFFLRKLLFTKLHKKLGKLQYFICAGAPLARETESFWNIVGIQVLQGYGLTETSPAVTTNTFTHWKEGSVGRCLPGQAIKLLPNGEIIVKGDNVTLGYYQHKQATQKAFSYGWFHTGDLGALDKAGFLTLKGRLKNVIITSSGMNVYPEDIELLLNKFSSIKDSCVLGLQRGKDVVITAVVLLRDTVRRFSKASFLQTVNNRLSSHQQVKELVVWHEEDFPRTPTMKIKKREVAVILKRKKAVPLKSLLTKNKLYTLLSRLTSVHTIRPTSKLVADLHLDSLSRVELITLLEEEYGVELSEAAITERTTVQQLAYFLKHAQRIQQRALITRWQVHPFILPLRFCLQSLLSLLTLPFVRVTVKGVENIPRNQPVLFVSNHTSYLDVPVLLRVLPTRVRLRTAAAGSAELFFDVRPRDTLLVKKLVPFIGRLVLNAYPFSRRGYIKKSLEATGSFLDRGYSVLLFPEGERTLTGKLQPFKQGIGLLAVEMGVPVIPIKLRGLYTLFPRGSTWPKRGSATVTFGKPLLVQSRQSYLFVAKQVERAIKHL